MATTSENSVSVTAVDSGSEVLDLKDRGNNEFKAGKYENALLLYGQAINKMTGDDKSRDKESKELKSTLLINRAAAYLKVSKFSAAAEDCERAIELNPASTKAYYRLASALYNLGEDKKAYNNLSKLLSMDPKNADGVKLMRDVRQRIQDEERNSTPISKTLQALQNSVSNRDTSNSASSSSGDNKPVPLPMILKELASMCADDKYNAVDFGKRDGVRLIGDVLSNHLAVSSSSTSTKDNISVLALRVFALVGTQKIFVQHFVDMVTAETSANSTREIEQIDDDSVCVYDSRGKLLFARIVELISSKNADIATAALHAAVQHLKSFAEHEEETAEQAAAAAASAGSTGHASVVSIPTLPNAMICAFLNALNHALDSGDPVLFITAADAFSAFISNSPAYLTAAKLVDSRYENLADRKERMRAQKYLHDRAEKHGRLAVKDCHCIQTLCKLLDSENPLMRQRAGVCFGHLLKSFDDEALVKSALQPFIDATDQYSEGSGGVAGKSIVPFRQRACITGALLMSTKSELGVWALEQRQGVQQLLVLVSTNDVRCQEVAAEVMCLCSSTENGPPLLAPVVECNVLTNLLASPNEGIKAAAAATMTKLSIKAKAFENNEDTDELTSILNSVLTVLKQSPLSTASNATGKTTTSNKNSKDNSLVSFSKLDKLSIKDAASKDSKKASSSSSVGTKDDYAASVADMEGGLAYVSVERAIEVLAALVGKTFVKEEIVHGSYR
jgi:tetratricopeptide (TPR) repeat protein